MSTGRLLPLSRRVHPRVLLLLLPLLVRAQNRRVHPLVLVPGNGGSQVEGRLNKTEVVHYVCSKNSDWFNMWLNLELMVPTVIDCLVDNLKLFYDKKTRKTRNSDGVDIRIPGFGNTTSVEYLDPSQRFFSVYYAKIVASLVKQGYQRGVNLHGAPYDFRKAPNEHGEYFKMVKILIEDTYSTNYNTSVILLTHSMGSPMMLYFLNHQTTAWKEKYIRTMITLAGPWGGAETAIKVFAVGDNFGAWPVLNKRKVMWEMRTHPGLIWLMPTRQFWNSTEVLVETSERNYTSQDYQLFFEDISEPNAWLMKQDTENLTAELLPPEVEVYCIHGSGVQTVEKLVYENGTFPDLDPVEEMGDGDGTVNLRSLTGCRKWQTEQIQRVHHHLMPGVSHLGILREEKPVAYITGLVEMINDDLNFPVPVVEIIY